MNDLLLEICCYSVESAIIAEKAGADRIELCAGIYEGGTTPSMACISLTKDILTIPIHVIIRPRGSDFCYSEIEFECMKQDIIRCKELGIDGVVSGVLLADGSVDIIRTKELVKIAAPMSFTFHRAFDMVKYHQKAFDELTEIGVNRILTSGGKQTAVEGMELIRSLIQKSNQEIVVMPGSGIDENNIEKLRDFTHANEFHCSAKKLIRSSMQYKNPNINMGGESCVPEFEYYEANAAKIKTIVKRLKNR